MKNEQNLSSIFIWITSVIFFVLIDTSTIQYYSHLQISSSQIFVIFLCQSILAICHGFILYAVSKIVRLPKEHEIWNSFLLGFWGSWSCKILVMDFDSWRLTIALLMWVGIVWGIVKTPSSKIRSGTVLLTSFILAAQISSQRMQEFKKTDYKNESFKGVIFAVVQEIPTNLLQQYPKVHFTKIRMSTSDRNLAKQSLLYGKNGWENILPTDQNAMQIFENNQFTSICFSGTTTPFSFECGSNITGQTFILGWRYSFYGSLFPKDPKWEERALLPILQSKKKYFIYIDTHELSEDWFQKHMPYILEEDYVVSLLSLDENKVFQDWIVFYPNIIKDNKRATSLLQHHDVVPTLLEITGLSPIQTASGYAFVDSVYGKAARPFVRQIQTDNKNMQMDIYYRDIHTLINVGTTYESLQPTKLPKDIFEDSKTILQSVQNKEINRLLESNRE